MCNLSTMAFPIRWINALRDTDILVKALVSSKEYAVVQVWCQSLVDSKDHSLIDCPSNQWRANVHVMCNLSTMAFPIRWINALRDTDILLKSLVSSKEYAVVIVLCSSFGFIQRPFIDRLSIQSKKGKCAYYVQPINYGIFYKMNKRAKRHRHTFCFGVIQRVFIDRL